MPRNDDTKIFIVVVINPPDHEQELNEEYLQQLIYTESGCDIFGGQVIVKEATADASGH